MINTGAVDSEGPQLVAISSDRDIINLMAAPGSPESQITLSLTMLDTESGLASVSLTVESLQGVFPPKTIYGTPNPLTSSVVFTYSVDPPSVPGTYVYHFTLRDGAGNESSYHGGFDTSNNFPGGFDGTFKVVDSAYNTWARDLVRTWIGPPSDDDDGDGLPNGIEFLCGTKANADSFLFSGDDTRIPRYSWTPTHLRVEYRLSAQNAALGVNDLLIQPQSSEDLVGPWLPLTPTNVSGDLWRAEVPITSQGQRFLRLSAIPAPAQPGP